MTCDTGDVVPDGLVAVVKRDCPTCQLVVPVLAELARHGSDAGEPLTVYSQDDPTFPEGLGARDDTDLELSFALDIDTVPTLLRMKSGEIVDRTEGWERSRWETLTGVDELGADLPDWRPG